MGLNSTLGSLLIFLWMSGMWAGFAEKNCTNNKLQFERVFSVPGEVAMLSSTRLSPDVLNFSTIPYNITWYNSKTRQELSNQTGQILIVRETLWFLNTTLDDAGEYTMLLRTPSKCYMQSTKLVVDLPVPGECGRPKKTSQTLTKDVADHLNCPLSDYINKLNSYNIPSSLKWYKGCDLILDGKDGYRYTGATELVFTKVKNETSGMYTCTLTFTLGDVPGSVSETIIATIRDKYSLAPQVQKPTNETIRAEIGSNFTNTCLVFVPGLGIPDAPIVWVAREDFIFTTDPSERVYTSNLSLWPQHEPKGVWMERLLVISELRQEDFNINYTCLVLSSWGKTYTYFTLLQPDPNLILPIGLVFGSVTALFIISVIIYYIFRIDIVLGFRRTFPILYKNKDLDGKLYDAYVTYPQLFTAEFSKEVEKFALQTLPDVLERTCGYKLFIAGRDSLPGQAIMDSVDENIKSSRRVLLLYTASTFISHTHTSSTSSNNNNVSKNNDDKTESKSSDSSMGLDGGDKVFSDTRQQLECVTAMHRALLEGSLKVVLVELEQITPAQLALFPESVRHLRRKQGAVCWWKNLQKIQRRGTCVRWRRDEEKDENDSQLSPSLCPSSRFWKEMRYHMPVRGKRVVSAEKTALLNL